ncbi:MAG: Ni/Fe-hydrogenase, b-type cytochrome subunit [Nitrospirota bacterium]
MDQQKIREWNLAYILDHWIRVAVLVILIFTGFFISRPFIAGGPSMSWMRFLHFFCGYILILGLVVRMYLAFRSSFYADWKDFSIIRILKNIPDIAGYYLFLKKTHKDYQRYNPLQALSYLFTGVMILVSAVTGFALYHGNVFLFIKAPAAFEWVNTLLGGESYTRIWHILIMWYFIIFTLIHVYMAVMNSLINRDGALGSMITGYKTSRHRNDL